MCVGPVYAHLKYITPSTRANSPKPLVELGRRPRANIPGTQISLSRPPGFKKPVIIFNFIIFKYLPFHFKLIKIYILKFLYRSLKNNFIEISAPV